MHCFRQVGVSVYKFSLECRHIGYIFCAIITHPRDTPRLTPSNQCRLTRDFTTLLGAKALGPGLAPLSRTDARAFRSLCQGLSVSCHRMLAPCIPRSLTAI